MVLHGLKNILLKHFTYVIIFVFLKIHISYGFEKSDKAISPPTPPIAASEQFDPAQQKKAAELSHLHGIMPTC